MVVGTFNLLVVLIQWKGHEGRTVIPKQEIESMFMGSGVGEAYPGGSITNFTSVNSHGKFNLQATVTDYFQSEFTEQEVGSGSVPFHQAIIPALESLDDAGFEFSLFDNDGDFLIDSMVVLHSGYAREAGSTDEDDTPTQDRIQSRAGAFFDFRTGSGYRSDKYARASIYRGVEGQNIATIGIIAHEFLHTLGPPDLYDLDNFDGDQYTTVSVGGIGGFDIMAATFGQSGGGATPGHLSPWTKIFLGWADPVDIKSDGLYALRASELHNDYAIISSPYDEGEYLVIENRQPLLFDVGFWGGGGLVIYKVDENTGNFGNRNRGGPFQAGWPGNGNGFMVSVLQADGLYELEQGANNGDEGDLWRPGQSLGPGSGELIASSAVYPNTDGYTNGQVKVTGLTIDSFTEVEPGVWSFRVTGLGGGSSPLSPTIPPASFPSNSPTPRTPSTAPTNEPTKSPTQAPTPTPEPTKNPSIPPSSVPTEDLQTQILFPSSLINPGNDEKTAAPTSEESGRNVISSGETLFCSLEASFLVSLFFLLCL